MWSLLALAGLGVVGAALMAAGERLGTRRLRARQLSSRRYRAVSAGVLIAWTGLSLIGSWSLTRYSLARWDWGNTGANEPSPDWLWVVGVCAVAVGAASAAVVFFRSPFAGEATVDGNPAHAEEPTERQIFVALFSTMALAAVVASIAAGESDFRWRPLITAAALAVLVPLIVRRI